VMHFAALNCSYEIVRLLLVNGVDPNMKNSECETALMTVLGCMRGNADIVVDLLSCVSDLSIRDADDRTALHWAVENDEIVVSRKLIEMGADPAAADKEGLTASDYSTRLDQTESTFSPEVNDDDYFKGSKYFADDKSKLTRRYHSIFRKSLRIYNNLRMQLATKVDESAVVWPSMNEDTLSVVSQFALFWGDLRMLRAIAHNYRTATNDSSLGILDAAAMWGGWRSSNDSIWKESLFLSLSAVSFVKRVDKSVIISAHQEDGIIVQLHLSSSSVSVLIYSDQNEPIFHPLSCVTIDESFLFKRRVVSYLF